MPPFEPHPLLRNPHLMTIVAAFWPRRHPRLPPHSERLFEVESGTRMLARCHWHAEPRRHPTLVLVHGLDGSSESPYMLGTAGKAFRAGFNVIRLNQRNCGGTEHLASTLYNSGLSGDLRAVAQELIQADALPELFLAGFSMGGNLVLKMAGEMGASYPSTLRAVCAISPSLDLAACAEATMQPRNRIYQWHFIRSLKRRMRRKAQLFPGRYPVEHLPRVHTMREFDDIITAPHFGYKDAADYYFRASALRVVAEIRIPTLILTAEDDPLIPFVSYADPALASNPHITLVAPPHGGHCGFISRTGGDERFWAEVRIVEFCFMHSQLCARGPKH